MVHITQTPRQTRFFLIKGVNVFNRATVPEFCLALKCQYPVRKKIKFLCGYFEVELKRYLNHSSRLKVYIAFLAENNRIHL